MMKSKVSCAFPLSISLFQLCAVDLTSLFVSRSLGKIKIIYILSILI